MYYKFACNKLNNTNNHCINGKQLYAFTNVTSDSCELCTCNRLQPTDLKIIEHALYTYTHVRW